MSATLINLTGFLYGVVTDVSNLAILPDGFKYKISERDFIKAEGPRGTLWYYQHTIRPHLARCGVATKDDVRRTRGKEWELKRGQFFYDKRIQIACGQPHPSHRP